MTNDPCDFMLSDKDAAVFAVTVTKSTFDLTRVNNVYDLLADLWEITRDQAKMKLYFTMYGGRFPPSFPLPRRTGKSVLVETLMALDIHGTATGRHREPQPRIQQLHTPRPRP